MTTKKKKKKIFSFSEENVSGACPYNHYVVFGLIMFPLFVKLCYVSFQSTVMFFKWFVGSFYVVSKALLHIYYY